MKGKKIGVLQPNFSTKMYTPQELETLEDAEEHLKMAGTIIEFLPGGTMNTLFPVPKELVNQLLEEGKSEIGEEVTYGNTTYKQVSLSNGYGAETCLVSYYKRADGKNIYVEISTKQTDFDKLQIDDPLVQELAKSAVYK